jgi:S1-C subfamily serine protease
MKKLLSIICFLIVSIGASAQKFSTINFANGKMVKDFTFTIYLNEQQIGTIKRHENLSYKIYSEGRITVNIIMPPVPGVINRATTTIDVKSGNTYYMELGMKGYVIKKNLVDEAKGKELFAENENTINVEEDKRNPVGKINAEIENEGPKQGSCFLLNKQGYLLTNNHVIDGAKTIQIKGIGNDFTTLYAADVIAKDLDLDLAVLKLKNQNIVFENLPYRISDEIFAQGTKSLSLGYPMTSAMGEEIKITEGIINAKSGYKGTLTQYQFSAAVQPGNSGSPLFNDSGEVIGVINAKLKDAENVGYALKSSYLLTFLKNVDNFQLDKTEAAPLGAMPLSEKVTKLKGFIFIVKAE